MYSEPKAASQSSNTAGSQRGWVTITHVSPASSSSPSVLRWRSTSTVGSVSVESLYDDRKSSGSVRPNASASSCISRMAAATSSRFARSAVCVAWAELRRSDHRHPSLGPLDHPSAGGLGVAADPDRDRVLHRLGPGDHVAGVEVPALVAERLALPVQRQARRAPRRTARCAHRGPRRARRTPTSGSRRRDRGSSDRPTACRPWPPPWPAGTGSGTARPRGGSAAAAAIVAAAANASATNGSRLWCPPVWSHRAPGIGCSVRARAVETGASRRPGATSSSGPESRRSPSLPLVSG